MIPPYAEVLLGEIDDAASRIEVGSDLADALLVVDRYDRLCRLPVRETSSETSSEASSEAFGDALPATLAECAELAELCREDLQQALDEADTLDAFRQTLDRLASGEASEERGPVFADDLFGLAGACAWLRGTARKEVGLAVREVMLAAQLDPGAFLALAHAAEGRLDVEAEVLQPALLDAVLQACADLPLAELLERHEQARDDAERAQWRTARADREQDRVGDNGQWTAAPLKLAADDGADRATNPDTWQDIAKGTDWELAAQVGPEDEHGRRSAWIEVFLSAVKEEASTELLVVDSHGEPVRHGARWLGADRLLVQVESAGQILVALPDYGIAASIDLAELDLARS